MEVVDALVSGCIDGELSKHIASCHLCMDAAEVVRAIQDYRTSAVQAAQVPPAGLVWWRAELRARQNASRVARRPLTLANAFAAACAIGVALALISSRVPWFREALSAFDDLPRLGLLIGAVVAFAIIAPVAVYFVVSDD
jgi:hypothetical protein